MVRKTLAFVVICLAVAAGLKIAGAGQAQEQGRAPARADRIELRSPDGKTMIRLSADNDGAKIWLINSQDAQESSITIVRLNEQGKAQPVASLRQNAQDNTGSVMLSDRQGRPATLTPETVQGFGGGRQQQQQ